MFTPCITFAIYRRIPHTVSPLHPTDTSHLILVAALHMLLNLVYSYVIKGFYIFAHQRYWFVTCTLSLRSREGWPCKSSLGPDNAGQHSCFEVTSKHQWPWGVATCRGERLNLARGILTGGLSVTSSSCCHVEPDISQNLNLRQDHSTTAQVKIETRLCCHHTWTKAKTLSNPPNRPIVLYIDK